MKVKVRNKIYDGEKEPVMVILSKSDKENIASMTEESEKYCSYPEGSDEDEIVVWMNDGWTLGTND